MTTTATRTRLRELHSLFVSEYKRGAWLNAAQILLEIGKDAKSFGVKWDADAPTASGEKRAEYWHTLFNRLRENNQTSDSLKIAKMWAQDRAAA